MKAIGHVFGCALMVLSAAGISPAFADEPTDENFCDWYSAFSVAIAHKAITQNPDCLDFGRGLHENKDMHFSWCMRNTKETVTGAGRHIADLAEQCSAPSNPRPAQNNPDAFAAKVAAGGQTWMVERLIPGVCYAELIDNSKQEYFGRMIRFEFSDGQYRLVSDFSRADGMHNVLVDGRGFRTHFEQVSDAVTATVGQDFIAAVKRGSRLNLNFEPDGPGYSLSGSAAALDMMLDCASGRQAAARQTATQPAPPPASPPTREPSVIQGSCRLIVDGMTYIDRRGDCPIWMENDGSGRLWINTNRVNDMPDYFAELSPDGNGFASGHWNGEPGATHAQGWLGDDFQLGKGGCWSNSRATICAAR